MRYVFLKGNHTILRADNILASGTINGKAESAFPVFSEIPDFHKSLLFPMLIYWEKNSIFGNVKRKKVKKSEEFMQFFEIFYIISVI